MESLNGDADSKRPPLKRVASVSRGSSAYPRKRAVVACQVCRARRTKCDQKKPACSFCESTGAECVTDSALLSAYDPASLDIIQRLDSLDRKFSSLSDTLKRGPGLASTQRRGLASSSAGDGHQLYYQSVDQVLSWPVFQQASMSTSPQSAVSESARTRLSLAVQKDTPSPVVSAASAMDVSLGSPSQTELVDRFFAHVHKQNPILNEPTARLYVQQVDDNGLDWGAESCLVLMIWALGCLGRPLSSMTTTQSEDQANLDAAAAFFTAASQRLGPLLLSTGVVHTQCVFLAGTYLMAILRPLDAWRMFLHAIAMCQAMRRVDSSMPIDHAAVERLYWSSWKSERELHKELWLDEKRQTSSLEHPESFPDVPRECEGDDVRTWYFYLSEISAWRLHTQIEAELSKSAAQDYTTTDELCGIADAFLQQAADWQNSLSSSISLDPDWSADDGDMLRLILRARVANMDDVITWPFLYRTIHDGLLLNDVDSAKILKWVERGLSCHLRKLRIHRVHYYHRHHGTWMMVRSCARSVSILLAAARTPISRSLLPSDWREPVQLSLQMLQFWRTHLPALGNTVERLCDYFVAT